LERLFQSAPTHSFWRFFIIWRINTYWIKVTVPYFISGPWRFPQAFWKKPWENHAMQDIKSCGTIKNGPGRIRTPDLLLTSKPKGVKDCKPMVWNRRQALYLRE